MNISPDQRMMLLDLLNTRVTECQSEIEKAQTAIDSAKTWTEKKHQSFIHRSWLTWKALAADMTEKLSKDVDSVTPTIVTLIPPGQ